MEFIKMIQSIQIPEEHCFQVTMDIESLYTNVPLEGCLHAASPTTHFFPVWFWFLLPGVRHKHGDKNGSQFCFSVLCFFKHEIAFNHQRNPYLPFISNWKRYTDDIVFIWNWRSSIFSLTLTVDEHEMNSLDILVYSDSNRLGSNLYCKKHWQNLCATWTILPSHSRGLCLYLSLVAFATSVVLM